MYNHSSLKSYGTGTAYTSKQWHAFLRELVNNGCIDVVGDKYPVLKLNQKSWDILSGKASVVLVKPVAKEQPLSAPAMPQQAGAFDPGLFEALRALRKTLADSAGVPPYIIFPDTTLKELATHRPQDLNGLKTIYGIGQIKLERYGSTFLEAIRDYCGRHGLAAVKKNTVTAHSSDSDTYRKTLELCREGMTLEQIAAERNLAPSTIAAHIEKLLTADKDINIDSLVSKEKQQAVQECMQQSKIQNLMALREKLGDGYSYEELRIARAKIKSMGIKTGEVYGTGQ